jgi:beta-lactamase superfamily II metal-dependent hydrolase
MTQVPKWAQTLQSYIWIFNVGRGLSIFIRTALNQGILYDFGCSQYFSPTKFLSENILPHLDKYKKCKIAQTIISHPHADHIAEISCLASKDGKDSPFYSSLHTCPHDKAEGSAKPEAVDWERIKNPEGSEEKIKLYKKLYASRNLPLQTINYESARSVPNIEYGLFYIRPPEVNEIHPSNDQDYGNGISLVFFYRHGKHTLLIPGDITPDALKSILNEGKGLEKRYTIFNRQKCTEKPHWHDQSSDQPSLRSLLKKYGLSILVAPHHGLESGFSEDLYISIENKKPNLVVISDKRHISDKDGIIDKRYQAQEGASGLDVFVEDIKKKQYSVSTRNGHHILISFEGTGGYPKVFLDSNPEKLLKKIGG